VSAANALSRKTGPELVSPLGSCWASSHPPGDTVADKATSAIINI